MEAEGAEIGGVRLPCSKPDHDNMVSVALGLLGRLEHMRCVRCGALWMSLCPTSAIHAWHAEAVRGHLPTVGICAVDMGARPAGMAWLCAVVASMSLPALGMAELGAVGLTAATAVPMTFQLRPASGLRTRSQQARGHVKHGLGCCGIMHHGNW